MAMYTLSNICGAPYTGGVIRFTPDGGCVLVPVGNRLSVYDLQTSTSVTMSSETRSDIKLVVCHPYKPLSILVDVNGYGYVFNLLRDKFLHRLQFKSTSTIATGVKKLSLMPFNESQRMVTSACFSPNGKYFAIAMGSKLQIWRSPEEKLCWRMTLHRELTGHIGTINSIDWSDDSCFLCTSSKDLTVRLWSVDPVDGFTPCAFVDHRRSVKAAFFMSGMKGICSISKEGLIILWKAVVSSEVKEDAINAAKNVKSGKARNKPNKITSYAEEAGDVVKLNFADVIWMKETQAYCNQAKNSLVSMAAYNRNTNFFVVGFTGGIFSLYKLPELTAIYTLRIGNDLPVVDSVDITRDGDWLGLACSETGTLVVWEWKSETYIMKQQGHYNGVRSVAFSTAGSHGINIGGAVEEDLNLDIDQRYEKGGLGLGNHYVVATGGFDGKVKLWDSNSGLCYVTFEEHSASVEAICFTPQANAIITASLDGTVRAFDLLRYRNFRTLTSSRVQYTSVACDCSGSIVAAGSKGDTYSVCIWNLQTGKLLDELHGHSAPVSSVAFHPHPAFSGILVSSSWDKFINIWNVYGRTDKGGAATPLLNSSSVTAISFDPRGNSIFAVAVMCGRIIFWDLDSCEQIGTIDGIRDIQRGRDHSERFSANSTKRDKDGSIVKSGSNKNQHFNSIAYVSGGSLLIACSRDSPNICVYSTESFSLLYMLVLTRNLSFSGILRELNSKYVTEYGYSIHEYDLSDEDEPCEGAHERKRIQSHNTLPGVQFGEFKKERKRFHVWSVASSSDSRQLAAATSHGLYVYSLDSYIKMPSFLGEAIKSMNVFEPQLLTENVTTINILSALERKEYTRAFVLALALNDFNTLLKCYESIPINRIGATVASVSADLICVLLNFIRIVLNPDSPNGTIHLNFHLIWLEAVFSIHMHKIGNMDINNASSNWQDQSLKFGSVDLRGVMLLLLRQLRQTRANTVGIFFSNAYTIKYIRHVCEQRKLRDNNSC